MTTELWLYLVAALSIRRARSLRKQEPALNAKDSLHPCLLRPAATPALLGGITETPLRIMLLAQEGGNRTLVRIKALESVLESLYPTHR